MAVVLCVVSCQTEPEGLDVNVGGEIDAIVNVTIPEVETRATDSAEGAFKNVNFNDYTIRYILQVYYNNEPSQERLVKYSDDKSVAFDVRLVPGRDYQFVVWADVVDGEDKGDKHYNTEVLHDIKLNGKWNAMDESRDAFTATVAVNNYSSASNITVKLQRPFAKLRVVTTDMVALSNIGIEPAKATVEYTVKHYNAFNAFEGKVINDSKNRDIKHEEFDIAVYGDNSNTDKVLFTDYFFPTEDNIVKFNLTVKEKGGKVIGETVAFNTDIPVNANYLTTIKGNILTDGKNFEVKIEDAFAGETEWPNTPAGELVAAAMFGGEITLTENVRLTEPLKVTSELTINLNGKTITTTEKEPGRHHYAIDNYGTLTLKGEGAINARGIENFGTMTINGNITITNVDTNGGSAIWNEGNLVINGGTFTTNAEAGEGSYGSALNTQVGGSAVINGGNFTAYSQLTYAILNYGETVINNATVKGKHGAVGSADGAAYKTTINGGSFELMENPGVSDHCTYYVSAIYGGTFSMVVPDPAHGDSVFWKSTIADGYKVIENNGKFNVVSADVDNVVANKGELKTVLEAVAAGTTDVVIDANGANIGDLNYGLKTALVPAGRTVTIRNANVQGKSYGNGVDGTVIFEGCTFNNSGAYSIHFDNGNGDVIFKNCKLYGWNSFGSSLNSVSFENCTLDGNGTYALIRSYVTLTLTNCVINTSNANHTDAYSEGVEAVAPATLTENNVTYVADNADALADALANGGSVVMTDDIETEAATTAPYGNKYAYKLDGGTLDGNGHELYMECYGDDYGIMTSGGTIKNLTIEEGCRAVMIMYPTQDVILDNVNIGGDGVLYPINTGEAGAEGVKLVVTNSTLAGWTSYGEIESASFTNVKFEQGTYYNNIYGRVLKPYVNTTLTNCSFIEHMNLDLSKLNNGHKVTFKNCTVNGQVITASTFTVPSTDAEYDTELFTIDLPSWASSVNDCVIFE